MPDNVARRLQAATARGSGGEGQFELAILPGNLAGLVAEQAGTAEKGMGTDLRLIPTVITNDPFDG